MIDFKKYEKEMEILNNVIFKDLNMLKIDAVRLYGSCTNSNLFIEGISDIDVIIFCNNFEDLNIVKVCDKLNSLNISFGEKRPTFIEDILCARIEFYIKLKNISFDITIMGKSLIPSKESLIKVAWYDSFESLMGGVYINSIPYYGEIPDKELFNKEFFPFYDNNIRKQRLNILSKRIKSYNVRIKKYLEIKSPDIVDHLFKVKKFFFKFIFILKKKYPLTPEKHTYHQIKNILGLDEKESMQMAFLIGDVFEIAKNYLALSEKYLREFDNE